MVVLWVVRKEEAVEDAEGGGLEVKVRVVVEKRRRDRVAIAGEEVFESAIAGRERGGGKRSEKKKEKNRRLTIKESWRC